MSGMPSAWGKSEASGRSRKPLIESLLQINRQRGSQIKSYLTATMHLEGSVLSLALNWHR
jgi:hypothetical protein